MRERRWESIQAIGFEDILTLQHRLKEAGLKVREPHQETACYIEAFSINHLDEIDRLSQWTIDEITLVQIKEAWSGDFFLLAALHHELYLEHTQMEGYLSLCHPWQIPAENEIKRHQPEALFWIGFRDTHGFIRVRIVPEEIIPPGEHRDAQHRLSWVTERALAFSSAIDVLDLPLFVEWHEGRLLVSTTDPASAVSVSWPDAFGPCQFEYVVTDRYDLLVPAARLVSKLGVQPATVKTFLSGFSQEALSVFHELQPDAQMLYRGYIHACLNDLPQVVEAVTANHGRVLINLCEFETNRLLLEGEPASAVLGVIGDVDGFKIEIRLNRAPLPEEKMIEWLNALTGFPVVYAPLSVY